MTDVILIIIVEFTFLFLITVSVAADYFNKSMDTDSDVFYCKQEL